MLGTGDSAQTQFQLTKIYGSSYAPYARPIGKPVPGSVRVAVAGVEVVADTDFICDSATGIVTFLPGHGPTSTFGHERATNPFVADSRFG